MALTLAQLFGIGFTFGLAGPCLFSCTPILMTYVVGNDRRYREALADIFIFHFGRFAAYILLGSLAGFSASLLRQFIDSKSASYLKPIAGALSITLAFFVLAFKGLSRDAAGGRCRAKEYGAGPLAALGFLIGLAPCAPLVTLLFQITLMSKNAFDGGVYALAFGLGTALSALIVVGSIAGIFTKFAVKFIASGRVNLIFRIICAALLVLFGAMLIR